MEALSTHTGFKWSSEKKEIGYYNEIQNELNTSINEWLTRFWKEGIRGGDFFISAIGPAMEVLSKYKQIKRYSGENISFQDQLDYIRACSANYLVNTLLKGENSISIDNVSLLISYEDISPSYTLIMIILISSFVIIAILSSLSLRTHVLIPRKKKRDFNLQSRIQKFKDSIKFLSEFVGGCGTGRLYCAIDYNGDIFPCVFIPIKLGNIKYDNFIDIWHTSPVLNKIRNRQYFKEKCVSCKYRSICGGCRARAYAYHGNLTQSDPGCILNSEIQIKNKVKTKIYNF